MSAISDSAQNIIKAAKGFYAACDVVIDANSAADQQILVVGSQPLYVSRLIFIYASGAPSAGTGKIGYNTGTTNNVLTAQSFATLTGAATAITATPNSGYIIGQPGQALNAAMTVLAGAAGAVRVICEAYGI